MKLLKEPQVLQLMALGRSTFRNRIKESLITPPVRLGPNSVAWPQSECETINAARIAGKTNDEIREIVARLVRDRQSIGAEVTA